MYNFFKDLSSIKKSLLSFFVIVLLTNIIYKGIQLVTCFTTFKIGNEEPLILIYKIFKSVFLIFISIKILLNDINNPYIFTRSSKIKWYLKKVCICIGIILTIRLGEFLLASIFCDFQIENINKLIYEILVTIIIILLSHTFLFINVSFLTLIIPFILISINVVSLDMIYFLFLISILICTNIIVVSKKVKCGFK